MSTYSLPKNVWLLIPQHWKTHSPVPHSDAVKFIFHHIRPTLDYPVSLATHSVGLRNQVQNIAARQISCITRVQNGMFTCCTVTMPHLDKFNTRYPALEYDTLVRQGHAAFWHLPYDNIFQGAWEVFNGPNVIDITGPWGGHN